MRLAMTSPRWGSKELKKNTERSSIIYWGLHPRLYDIAAYAAGTRRRSERRPHLQLELRGSSHPIIVLAQTSGVSIHSPSQP